MARPGVTPERIGDVIKQLEAEGAEVTVTALRERLGSGSYSTLGAVLNDWRREQARAARPAIPEVPETLAPLLRHLWAEAWKSADAFHEPERQAFARERAGAEAVKQEMAAEIVRLEEEAGRLRAAGESAREALAAKGQELEAGRLELAKVRSTVDFLQVEVERLRAEGEQSTENLTVWIERASKAVLRLEEAAKATSEDAAEKQNPDG